MRSTGVGIAAAVLLSGLFGSAQATLVYNVSFNDPAGSGSPFYAELESHVQAAGQAWGKRIVGDAGLEVEINFSDTIARATGRSVTSTFVGNNGRYDIWRQGAAGEIITGTDPNGSVADIEFTFNPSYLSDELWFDPDPYVRTVPITSNRTDAVSVLLHEFGHAFAFNGWRDPADGELKDTFASTFDANVSFDGSDLFFNGAQATRVHGEEVPLTIDNYGHLGNQSPRPGSELIPDLMNGAVFERGTRYTISALDVAVLADSGLATIPVPAAVWLFGSGLLTLLGMSQRRNKT